MIRAKSKIHKIKRNGREIPVVKEFSDEIWKRLPSITTMEGDVLPKMGYVKVVSEGEVLIDESQKKPASPPKPKKEDTLPVIDAKQVLEDHGETISAMQAGKEEDLNVKEDFQPLAKDLGLKVNQRRSILITEIKNTLSEAGIL